MDRVSNNILKYKPSFNHLSEGFSINSHLGEKDMQSNKAPVICGLAIISIICSLLFFIPLLGLIALVLGIMAMSKISHSNGKLTGQGLAMAGIIIGAICTFLQMLIVIAVLVSFPEMKAAFNKGRYKAISAKAKVNLENIYNLEEDYKSDKGIYINCLKNPPQMLTPAGNQWQMNMEGWKDINFNPVGDIYYQYEVINATKNSFTAIAVGDLDQDEIYSKFTITQDGTIMIENEYE